MSKNKVRLAKPSSKRMAAGGMMPWVSAGLGVVGIGTSIVQGIIDKRKAEEAAQEQRKLASDSRIATDNAYLSQYETEGVEGGIYAKGGKLKPIASNMVLAQGNTHGQGGIAIDSTDLNMFELGGMMNAPGGEAPVAEIENDEVMRNTDEGTQVYSEDSGHAAMAESLGKQKAQLEQMLFSNMNKISSTIDVANKDDDKYKLEGANRKLLAYNEKSKHLEQGIASIDQAMDELFENQQELNGGVGEEGGEVGEEAQPMMAAKGGVIKANTGAYIGKPTNMINALNWTNDKVIQPTWDWTKESVSKIGTSMKENPHTTANTILAGTNLASNLISNKFARDIEVPKPIQRKALTQDANVRTGHIEEDIKNRAGTFTDTLAREGGVNSGTRAARIAIEGQARDSIARVRGEADAQEKGIVAQNIGRIAETDNVNILAQEQHSRDLHTKAVADTSRGSAISSSFLNDVQGVIKSDQAQKNHEKMMEIQLILGKIDSPALATIMEGVDKQWSKDELSEKLDGLGIPGEMKQDILDIMSR